MDWLWNYLAWVVGPIALLIAVACLIAPVLGEDCPGVSRNDP